MTLEAMIRAAVEAGAQVHVWPEPFTSSYLGVVRARDGTHHCRKAGPDPIAALKAALAEDDRLRRDAVRVEVSNRDPAQLEIEEAIAATQVDDADLEGLLG